jgi:hypothetical protein
MAMLVAYSANSAEVRVAHVASLFAAKRLALNCVMAIWPTGEQRARK